MRRLVLAIFVLSGAAGLVYEVVWARQLVLVFGNTTQAVSAILTGFFGGMAIGSAVGGRIADRVQRTLRLYGILEIVLVVDRPRDADHVPPPARGLPRRVTRSLETAPVALALVRFVLALLALAPATILMGATLPTLTRHLSAHADELSAAFRRLYAANTIGAIVGAASRASSSIECSACRARCSSARPARRPPASLALLLDRIQAGRDRVASRRSARGPPTIIAPPVRPADPAGRPARLALIARVRVGPDVPRLPGPLDPAHRVGHRQLDVRLHAHPRAVPARHRHRRAGVRPPADPAPPDRGPAWRPPRSRSRVLAMFGMVILDQQPGRPGDGPDASRSAQLVGDFARSDDPHRPAGHDHHGPDASRPPRRCSWPARTRRSPARRAPARGQHDRCDRRRRSWSRSSSSR